MKPINNLIGDDAFEGEAPERRGALTLAQELRKEIYRCQEIVKGQHGFAAFLLSGAIDLAMTTIRSGNAIDMKMALENFENVLTLLAARDL